MPNSQPRSRRGFTIPTAIAFSGVLLGTLLLPKAGQPAPRVEDKSVETKKAVVIAPISFTDISGKQYDLETLAKSKASVFFFTATQCPVAGQYTPRMNELARDYTAKGVRFFLVNSDAQDTRQKVVQYARERKITFPVVKDNKTELADRLSATTTPQAIVLDATGAVRYIGRIDDSMDRAKVSRNDVRLALDAVLAGQPVKVSRTRAFGCQIFREEVTPVKTVAKVTYTRDVAPILSKNCVVCHRADDVAPFALDNYERAKVWSKAIKDYTGRRLMPPWKAVPEAGGPFHDERYLSKGDIQTLAAWADSGAPMGDPKVPAPKLNLPPAGEWQLGKPDVVLTAPTYKLEAEGKDVYRDFVLAKDFTEDTYVSGFEFRPGNRQIVHHIIAYIDVKGTSVARDGKDGQPGFSVSGGGSGIDGPEEWGDGWAPGMNFRKLEPGMAVKIPKGAKLILQVHYHKTGKEETDTSTIALHLAKEPVTDVFRTAAIGNVFFALQPNKDNQKVVANMTLPAALQIHSVLPHMHMLGKTMDVTATLPDGTVKPLISIRNWEFNWQMAYRYKEPIRLPRGTKLHLEATYDNTNRNPNQPANPPKLVTFGEQTDNEMCFAFFGFTVDRDASKK